MQSDFIGPVNIGSEEMVSINELVDVAARVAGKTVETIHVDGPLGVRGRNSNNATIRSKLGWDYSLSLEDGIKSTYAWVEQQINSQKKITEESARGSSTTARPTGSGSPRSHAHRRTPQS